MHVGMRCAGSYLAPLFACDGDLPGGIKYAAGFLCIGLGDLQWISMHASTVQ